MELPPACRSLESVLEEARACDAHLGVELAIAAGALILHELAALHAAGLEHRAVRPDHVAIAPDGAVTLVGRAALVPAPERTDPEAPADPDILYKLRYVSPEQIVVTGGIDASTDVWSSAVVISELVAGEHPIPSSVDYAVEIARAILGGLEVSPRLPAPIRELLGAALDRDRARRPSAAALRDALVEAGAVTLPAARQVIVRRLAELTSDADPIRATLPAAYRDHYDQVTRMPPSSVRDDLLRKITRMAGGDFDYFDWNGVAVRVACAGGACETFRDGAWRPGGPSYVVRQEEADPLTREQLAARFPDAARG